MTVHRWHIVRGTRRNLWGAVLAATCTSAVWAGSIGEDLGIPSNLNPIGRTTVGLAKTLAVGNPGSIANLTTDAFFGAAAFAGAPEKGDAASSGSSGDKKPGLFSTGSLQVGAVYSHLRSEGVTTRSITVPLSYSFRSELDPGRRLTFRLPITYTENDFDDGTHVGAGVDYRIPLNDDWAITPALNYTRAESSEFAGGRHGNLYSAAITSAYIFDLGNDNTVTLGNMLAFTRTSDLDPNQNVRREADQRNVVLRNGLIYARPVTLASRELGLQFSVAYTRYNGDEVLQRGYTEIGLSLGTGTSAYSQRDYYRLGLSGITSSKTKGGTINFGYWF